MKSSTGIYHVMMRGINRQMIFDDGDDYDAFLKILDRILHPDSRAQNHEQPMCELYAYALMGNHFHLLLKMLGKPNAISQENRTPDLGTVVKKIAAAYVMHFNRRHGRDGHLFKERFKSEPCETVEYFKTLMAYIHQNPVKAGLSKSVAEYSYTSWREYIGGATSFLCNTAEALKIVSFDEIKEAVETPLDPAAKCIEYEEKRIRRMVTDNYIAVCLADHYGLGHPDLIQSLPVKERNAILVELLDTGAGVRQLQRVTGVGLYVISRLNQRLQQNKK